MEILTAEELTHKLNDFRHVITDFDFSALKNVTFININALYTYIAEVEDNPFKKQYESIQKELQSIAPYIPFAMGNSAAEFLEKASRVENELEMDLLKREFSERSKIDFVETVRMIHCDEEWEYLTSICETIRKNKERSTIKH